MSNQKINSKTKLHLIDYFNLRYKNDREPSVPKIHRLTESIVKDIIGFLGKIKDHSERKTAIERRVKSNFETSFFKNMILSTKVIKDIRDVGDNSALRKNINAKKQPQKKEFIELYALYCGFAGIRGFEENITLYECFNIRVNWHLFDNEENTIRFIPPDLQQWSPDILFRSYQAKQDFYELFSGYYNVFNIDEASIQKENLKKSPTFEVSNFEFINQKGKFYFRELNYELMGNKLFPLENCPESNFYVQEIDEKWSYIFSFKRPKEKMKINGKPFKILIMGSTEPRHQSFGGFGYAVKVSSPDQLILPARELHQLKPDLLRLHVPITRVEFNDINETDWLPKQAYNEILRRARKVPESMSEELKEIEKKLNSGQHLLYSTNENDI